MCFFINIYGFLILCNNQIFHTHTHTRTRAHTLSYTCTMVNCLKFLYFFAICLYICFFVEIQFCGPNSIRFRKLLPPAFSVLNIFRKPIFPQQVLRYWATRVRKLFRTVRARVCCRTERQRRRRRRHSLS